MYCLLKLQFINALMTLHHSSVLCNYLWSHVYTGLIWISNPLSKVHKPGRACFQNHNDDLFLEKKPIRRSPPSKQMQPRAAHTPRRTSEADLANAPSRC